MQVNTKAIAPVYSLDLFICGNQLAFMLRNRISILCNSPRGQHCPYLNDFVWLRRQSFTVSSAILRHGKLEENNRDKWPAWQKKKNATVEILYNHLLSFMHQQRRWPPYLAHFEWFTICVMWVFYCLLLLMAWASVLIPIWSKNKCSVTDMPWD